MIPKVIHYCWFGGNPLPESAVKCISSWKKFLPDYEIMEWNESNYPLDAKCSYVREAYREKAWAFVSDYARFDILYHHGGVYFDTDVELIKSIDDILERGPFIGSEDSNATSVSSGLGLAANTGFSLFREILDEYEKRHFYQKNGEIDATTVVKFVSDILSKYPAERFQNSVVEVQGIYVYPRDYFCPMDYETGELTITENTRSIHHYSASWKEPKVEKWHTVQQRIKRKCGKELGNRMIASFPFRLIGTLYMYGFCETIRRQTKKYRL